MHKFHVNSDETWFQQDGALAHTVSVPVTVRDEEHFEKGFSLTPNFSHWQHSVDTCLFSLEYLKESFEPDLFMNLT